MLFKLLFNSEPHVKLDNACKIKLVSEILQLKHNSEISPNLLVDLELFDNINTARDTTVGKAKTKDTRADDTIFSKIDNTKTIFGNIYLQHLIKNPMCDGSTMPGRKTIGYQFRESRRNDVAGQYVNRYRQPSLATQARHALIHDFP